MKRSMLALFSILGLAAGASAQTTTHKALLTYTDTLNPTGTTYNKLPPSESQA
jgi:hypothetical protein